MSRLTALSVLLVASAVHAATFTEKPTAATVGGKTEIAFVVSDPTDVEVAIVDAAGGVVRHLAAGVLGGKNSPPPPLSAGLRQKLAWDGTDDMGVAVAQADGLKVRVRLGLSVKFARTIGDDPYRFGSINSITTDDAGQLYAISHGGDTNMNYDTLRAFASDGSYLRTVLPFPANLPPEAVAAFARWDDDAKCFRPINRSNLNPSFVPWGTGARLVSASPKAGIVLTHGTNIYRLDINGGNLNGPLPMWSKEAKLKNPAWNIPQLAVSPDGRYIYYSNVAGTVYQPKSIDDIDKNWPQGRVYRQDTTIAGSDPEKFYDLELPDWHTTKYWMPDAWNKRTAAYGITVDPRGQLYICDLVNQQIVEVSPQGKKVSATKVPWPERIHVDSATGNYYVVSRLDRPRDGRVGKKLVKVAGRGEQGKIVAELPLKDGLGEATALGLVAGKPVLWVAGGDDLLCLSDAGENFEAQETAYRPAPNGASDFSRIAVDRRRDEIYTNNGVNRFWRYDGDTGACTPLMTKDGKPFHGVDLAIGYDGLLYIRTGAGYSGPLERYSRELEPAPITQLGSHVLSKHIYSRYGVGFCEKGLGVGPQGEVYVNFMYGWNKYFIAGFGGDGKAIKGLYLSGMVGRKKLPEGIDPQAPENKQIVDAVKQSQVYPEELTSAVVGPVPMVCGGVRVDLQGNIYVGAFARPKGFQPPAVFAKDPAYSSFTGSVVKFGPTGGTFLGLPDAESKQLDAPRIELEPKFVAENALAVYPGVAPLSGGGFGNNSSSCVCRVARFDVDPFGRLALPNCVTNSVIVYDNAGNVVCEFGQYGNFDSRFTAPGSDKPTVAGPDIPLAWPTGAGFSERSIYVIDTYNRRIVRTDKTYATEESCTIGK